MSKQKYFSIKFTCLAFLMFFGLTASIYAVSLPIEENFDDESADNFTEAGASGVYSLNAESSGYSYQASISTSSGAVTGSSAIIVDDASSTSFVISTKLVLTSLTGAGNCGVNAGLGLFSSSADFSTGAQYRVLYQLTSGGEGCTGKLQIIRNGTSLVLSTATITPRLNVDYMLQAIVTHADGEVTIKALLSDDANTITVTATDEAPLPGTYFGYRTAANAVSGAAGVTVHYDDFSVLTGEGSPSGDQSVGGNLFVNGSIDVTGNDFLLGDESGNYGAALFYGDKQLTFHLSAADGSWMWKHEAQVSMTLNDRNVLQLSNPDGLNQGIILDPAGYSQFNGSLTLYGNDNQAPNQEATNEHSLLTVGLADARYMQADGTSSPTVPTVTVTGEARFEGSVHIAPQGDLSMGEFTEDPTAP